MEADKINFTELAERAHRNAANHGFWEHNPSNEHALMLVVSEVAEMVEADRKRNIAVIKHIRKQNNLAAAQKICMVDEVDNAPDFNAAFIENIKDTMEDEMADVAIRLLDLAGKLGMDFERLAPMRYHRAFDHFTFTENAFALCKGLCRENINIFKRIQFGLHFIKWWAKSQGVNLKWHIEAKMRFNESRPMKHGKAY